MASPKLKHIIENLKRRGRDDEAEFYEVAVPFELALLHGFSQQIVLEMTLDEIEVWYQKPPKPLKYEGWNFWWGRAADGRDNR